MLGLSSCKKDYTKTQLATKDEIKKAYLKKLLDCLTNYYQYVDKAIDMATFKEAINEAYSSVKKVRFANAFYRNDIGAKAMSVIKEEK